MNSPAAARRRRIEALVEDRSGAVILEALVRKLLESLPGQSGSWELKIRPHRGLGGLPKDLHQKPLPYLSSLLGLLPAKLRAYQRVLPPGGPDLVLLVCDSDQKDSETFFRELLGVCRRLAPDLPLLIGLAVEELESWMLADREAVLRAYPEADIAVLDRYQQDSICGTWEVLARAVLGVRAEGLILAGYPAVGMYKAEWAERISPYLDPERNLSPSFHRFRDALLRQFRNPLDRDELRARLSRDKLPK